MPTSSNRKMRRGRLAIVATSFPLCIRPGTAFLPSNGPAHGTRRVLPLEAMRKKPKSKLLRDIRRRTVGSTPADNNSNSDGETGVRRRRSLFRGLARSIEKEYQREEAVAMETLTEALRKTRESEDPLGYFKNYIEKAKARIPGDTETKYSLLTTRSYANVDVLDKDHMNDPPTLEDLNQKPYELKDSYWVAPPFRLSVFFGSYFIFPYITEFFKVVETTEQEDFSLVAGQFGPGVGVLYGTIVALTLDILYERQSRVQENATVEAGLLSQITQHLLALFDGDDKEQYELARDSCQLVADQVRTLVKRTRGAELLTIMKADPYSQLLAMVDDFHREKGMSLSLQEQSVVASLREDIPQIMEARAKRLSDEASALPPTHFLVLSLLTGLIMVGYVVSTLTITDAEGRPPQESQLVFAALTAIYVLFYNFCNDLNGPFQGVYQIRRSSAASYLLQIKWLVLNQPFGKEVQFEDVEAGPADAGKEADSAKLGQSLADAAKSALDKVKNVMGGSSVPSVDSHSVTTLPERANGDVEVTMNSASQKIDQVIVAPGGSDHNMMDGDVEVTVNSASQKIDQVIVAPGGGSDNMTDGDVEVTVNSASQKIDQVTVAPGGDSDHNVTELTNASETKSMTTNGETEVDVDSRHTAVSIETASSSEEESATSHIESGAFSAQRDDSKKPVQAVDTAMNMPTDEIAATPAANVESNGIEDPNSAVSDQARYFLGTSGFKEMPEHIAAEVADAVKAREEDARRLLEEKRAKREEKWRSYYQSKQKSVPDAVVTPEEPTLAKMHKESVSDVSKERMSREERKAVDSVVKAEKAQEDSEENTMAEAKKSDEEAALRAAEEEKAKAESEAQARAAAEAKAKAEAERKRLEEASRGAAEEEAKRKAEEEEKARAEADARAAVEAERKREDEAARKAAEEETRAAAEAEEEARAAVEAEAEARAAAEAEARRRAEEDARLRPLRDRATGIEFAPKLDDLYLLGVGVRKKAIINVYSVAAYSSYEAKRSLAPFSAKSDRKAALSALRSAAKSSPAAFALEMAFKAGADAMANAIAESVAPRHSGDMAEVDELKRLIFDGVKAKGAATKGTTFLFECDSNGLTVSVDGEIQGMVLSDSLGSAFCDVFLDDKAVSPPLRDSCLQNCCVS